MKKTIACLFFAFGSLVAWGGPQYAPAKRAYRYNYGMAGCGLGSLVIEGPERHNDKAFQILASIINDLISPQSSAITSGTSNCTDTPQSVARMEQEVYISANFASLEKEAARGSGDHLLAFSDVMGCSNHNDHFVSLSQNRFGVIFSDSDAKAVLGRYVAEISSHPVLSRSCSRAL